MYQKPAILTSVVIEKDTKMSLAIFSDEMTLKEKFSCMMNEYGLEVEDVFDDILTRMIQVAPSEVESYIGEVEDYIQSFNFEE